ncbi:sugar transferase [Enterococcus mundtii]|uniref:UDP-phosphate galactose phosphotransferase n=1 Tax=Enterococcus mundtii TaxID=53346 RepID=A0ABQ0VAL4_ENTMU|nr:sugar transferase [Enterococcus mundtii]GEN16795.1 UDP-phosphate galactose phosphotransferase [Ligilactobacillus acidipiscis]AUB52115.1 UDP-phosphate galactose phosphotransferase [Enterococcus mundtii]MDB7087641.1 sugar transferase [Enterococcus mundtii]MZZ57744.1 exopolysaccharide biosynthesis polyprenyl glycosylphosphotransferase [Enterococcus mundtii]MZZ60719.1 exopolysaccharide biosynthesis polyprenyl glycosylphosphotransferase [Enterococcus mundtii]
MNKNGEWNAARRIFIIMLDVLVYNAAIYISFLLKFQGEIPTRNFETFQHSAVFISIIFIVLNILLGAYVFYNRMISDIIFVTVIGQVLMSLGVMVVTFAGRWFAFPRAVILLSLVVGTILLSLYRILVYKLYLKVSRDKKVVIVGLEKDVAPAIQNFQSKKNNKHKVEAVVIDNYYENIKKMIDTIDIVYLSSHIEENEKIKIYQLITKKEKKLFLNTTFENLTMINPNIMNFEDESIIEASGFKIQPEDELFKRLFDIIISFILLILASPFMLLTAILVKVTSPGPVIYKQVRITKNQKEFSIYKFRSMTATAEAKSGPVLAKSNDARVTPVGKFIRAVRFDELPQIFNVLKGDMSIVGPRPERPFFVDQFNAENPYYYLRHNVRAGITGYAQVYGKYVSDYNSKLRFDLLYIKKYSLMMDLKILLQTIKILFDKMSSQGLEEDENASSLQEIDFPKERIYR